MRSREICEKSRPEPDHSGWPGGDEGTRTPDPLVANQMLFQLSYAPRGAPDHHSDRCAASVGLPWLEQGTSVLSGPRSSQLSYRPVALPVAREATEE